jgi:hypothetical protein
MPGPPLGSRPRGAASSLRQRRGSRARSTTARARQSATFHASSVTLSMTPRSGQPPAGSLARRCASARTRVATVAVRRCGIAGSPTRQRATHCGRGACSRPLPRGHRGQGAEKIRLLVAGRSERCMVDAPRRFHEPKPEPSTRLHLKREALTEVLELNDAL